MRNSARNEPTERQGQDKTGSSGDQDRLCRIITHGECDDHQHAHKCRADHEMKAEGEQVLHVRSLCSKYL